MEVKKDLLDRYRPLPFWSWNDELDPDEVRRQVRAMHRAGLGGFFMHARGGLRTPYLSDRWMACVSAALSEAEKCGMSGWLYDENGWPSGFGNGAVNALGEKYQQKYLRREIADAAECGCDHTIAWYLPDGTPLGTELPEGFHGKVMRCFYEVNPFYVDNLNREVTAEFLRCTHEYYVHTLPPEILPLLKGIFTDEPQLSRDGFPWSEVLPEAYRKRCRRELLDDLPALFTDLPSSGTVRVNFWRTATELFRDGYIRQISSWCKAHNWLLTGHHLAEERPLDQIPANGSLMAHYSGYDIPGTDHLCRIKPDQVVMIQLVSAAMQSGKERILTESFGLSGWNLNFQGMYWIYHQQLACGIDLLCQHLSSYSLRGLRKRDYPGSYFVHQPWWEEYKTVNDHFAFAGVMIGRGKAETKLAVIHPLSTGWCNFTGDVRGPAADFYNGALIGLTGKLTAAFREFHFIDEMIFDESGGTAHGLLTVGKCAYDTVLIPPLTDLSAKIAGSLFDFAAAGGRIMMMNNRFEPGKLTLDGVPADEKTRSFFASLPHFDSAEEIVSALDAILPPVMRLLENGVPSSAFTGICRRIDGSVFGRSGKFYLIANGDYRQAHTLELFLPLSGAGVEIISPDGRQFSPVAGAETAGNFRHFPCHFAEGEGIMFFVPDETVSTAGPVSTADPYDRRVIRDLAGDFRLEGDPRNLLLLDRCRYRIDGGAWIDDDVSVIHGRLLRGRRDARLEMEFSFDIDDDFDLSEAIEVIAEDPARYTFSLNGKNFPAADTGMLFDSAFRRIKLPRALKRGRNTLTLSTVFHETPETWDILERAKRFETEYNRLTFESEIENIFLYGKFTIRHRGSVEVLDRSAFRLNGSFSLAPLHPGMTVDERNTVLDGFPFFAGRLTLRKTFRLNADEAGKIMFLRFKPLGANSFRIRINGVEAGFLYAGKFCIDVSGMLKEGENTVTVEMVSSLRNMLGPHHLAEGESYRVTTLSFSREANAVGWKPPEFADGYCVVGFGFSDMALTR